MIREAASEAAAEWLDDGPDDRGPGASDVWEVPAEPDAGSVPVIDLDQQLLDILRAAQKSVILGVFVLVAGLVLLLTNTLPIFFAGAMMIASAGLIGSALWFTTGALDLFDVNLTGGSLTVVRKS